MKLHHRPCIPYVWIMLESLKDKGLIGVPKYKKTTHPPKSS